MAPLVSRTIADVESARFNFEKPIAPVSIKAIREKALTPEDNTATSNRSVSTLPSFVRDDETSRFENLAATTTHWLIADAAGNIVCAMHSLSPHFDAGVIPPVTGVVMNESVSNCAYTDPDTKSVNFIAPGKRPRSTIASPSSFATARPFSPSAFPVRARIPAALLQVLLVHLTLDRPPAETIGDTRVHFAASLEKG